MGKLFRKDYPFLEAGGKGKILENKTLNTEKSQNKINSIAGYIISNKLILPDN